MGFVCLGGRGVNDSLKTPLPGASGGRELAEGEGGEAESAGAV